MNTLFAALAGEAVAGFALAGALAAWARTYLTRTTTPTAQDTTRDPAM
jgi:hypothetical protein